MSGQWTPPTVAQVDAVRRAADLLDTDPGVIPPSLAEGLSALFRRLVWMAELDMEFLGRVPCDEVIACARLVLALIEEEEKS